MIEIITCAPTANIGELKALNFLRDKLGALPGYHVVLTNYHFPYQNATLEIDLLVINARGVFLLEVKDWRGRIVGDSTHWLQVLFNQRHPSPLTSIDIKAKCVKSALVEAEPGLRNVSVVGFVVLTNGISALDLDEHPDRKKRVFALTDALVQALTGYDFLYSASAATLDKNRFPLVKDALLRKKVDPNYHLVGNYEIISELSPGAYYTAFEARHTLVKNRLVRLKKYRITVIESTRQLQEAIRRFQQDIEALSQLEGYPHIVHAYDFFKDPDSDDVYYLALEWVDGQTLREIIDDTTQVLSSSQVARYLIPVADALACCHQKGIIHRNLTPDSIMVTPQGQVKLGDFDFARVPAINRTISQSGQPLIENKYIAPEQLNDPRQSDYRADLYSLGVIWYDLLFRRPEDEPVRLTLVAQAQATGQLSDDARQLLRALLSPHPEERSQSASLVKEWLELFAEEEPL
jgi:tRNA A-37 threonylcarbamoyl transferase component Bud32